MGYIIIDDCNVIATKKLNIDDFIDNDYWFIDENHIFPKNQYIELIEDFYKSIIQLAELQCTGHIIIRIDNNTFGKYILKDKKVIVNMGKIIYQELYNLQLKNGKIEMNYNDRK